MPNAKTTFFVATDGNDKWSGRLASPNADGTDGPFATLTRARDAIRQLKYAEGLQQPIEVQVRGGTYYLSEPLRLSGGDSGTAQFPITYTAYPGEKPILSGGKRFTDWQTYQRDTEQLVSTRIRDFLSKSSLLKKGDRKKENQPVSGSPDAIRATYRTVEEKEIQRYNQLLDAVSSLGRMRQEALQEMQRIQGTIEELDKEMEDSLSLIESEPEKSDQYREAYERAFRQKERLKERLEEMDAKAKELTERTENYRRELSKFQERIEVLRREGDEAVADLVQSQAIIHIEQRLQGISGERTDETLQAAQRKLEDTKAKIKRRLQEFSEEETNQERKVDETQEETEIASKSIVCASLPEVKRGRWWFRQLFFNGKRMIRARYPKSDQEDPLYSGWAFVESPVPEGDENPIAFRYEPDIFPRRWAKPEQAEVFIIPGSCWISDIIPVKEVDYENHTIHLTRPVGPTYHTLTGATAIRAGNRFYVENVLEELTQPGEWCLDTETGTLYFWPPEGTVESGEVVAPTIERLIQMIGTPDEPVSHIAIRGFTLTHTLAQFPTLDSYYKTPNAGSTIYMENTTDCAIEDNLFDAVGGDAIRLQNNNARNRIVGNEIADAGAYGIFLGSFQRGFSRHDTMSGDSPSPPEWYNYPEDRDITVKAWPKSTHHLISNNHIHHVGVFEKHACGIAMFGISSVDNIISHNLIHHTPRFGIGMMSGFGRVIIEYNELHHLSLETCDTGGITANRWYTYEKDPDLCRGNIVRFNCIRDVIGCGAYDKKWEPVGSAKAGGKISVPYYGWAIYFDNAPMNVLVYGNITSRNTLGGIMISHYCKNVMVENNIFIDSDQSQAYLLFGGEMENIRFRRNIFSFTNPQANFLRLNLHGDVDLAEVLAEFDYNLFFNAAGKELTYIGLPGEGTMARWREMGYDEHSVIADPMFVDPANGNYALKPDSPAMEIGFKPIDLSRIGLVCDVIPILHKDEA